MSNTALNADIDDILAQNILTSLRVGDELHVTRFACLFVSRLLSCQAFKMSRKGSSASNSGIPTRGLLLEPRWWDKCGDWDSLALITPAVPNVYTLETNRR